MKLLIYVFLLLVIPTMAWSIGGLSGAGTTTAGTGNLSWTHSVGGRPKAVVVFIYQYNNGTDQVSGVTYGGISMTEVSGSPQLKTAAESGALYAYVLTSNITAGNKTVVVTVTGSATKQAYCYSIAGDGLLTKVVGVNTSIYSDAVANPSSTLGLGGVNSMVLMGLYSGGNDASAITPSTGWTSYQEYDFGACMGATYKYNTVGTSNVTVGWTQASDDAMAIAIAIADSVIDIDTTTISGTTNIEDNFRSSVSTSTNYGNVTQANIASGYPEESPTSSVNYTIAYVGSSLPENKTIVACTLKVYAWFVDGETVDLEMTYPTLSVNRILKPWYEMNQTFDDWFAPDSEYTPYSGDQADNNGDGGATYSFWSTAASTISLTLGTGQWMNFDVTDLMSGWYSGTIGKRGVRISAASITGGTSDSVAVYSSEYTGDTSLTPRFVVVTETIPSATSSGNRRKQIGIRNR